METNETKRHPSQLSETAEGLIRNSKAAYIAIHHNGNGNAYLVSVNQITPVPDREGFFYCYINSKEYRHCLTLEIGKNLFDNADREKAIARCNELRLRRYERRFTEDRVGTTSRERRRLRRQAEAEVQK